MKILFVHNYYGSSAPSGENQVVESEMNLLRAKGHEVLIFSRHSDEIRRQGAWGAVRGAMVTPWNIWMAREIKKEAVRFQPDIVHVHNTFPLISPSIFHALEGKVARVLTLHNFRLFCPAGIPMREGKVCTDCIDKHSVLPALKHGCYRGSRVATIPLAMNVELHRKLGTWKKYVDGFIALTGFQKERMSKAGLPLEKIYVKPNFYPGNPSVMPWKLRKPYIVFVGRLGEEKGVRTLLQAWSKWGADAPELRMIGDGNIRSELEKMAKDLPIQFLGQLSSEDAQLQIAEAKLLILPSECFEGFPMVIREAFAFGTPVVTSDLGPLPSIVTHNQNGLVFRATDHKDLLQKVEGVWDNPDEMNKFSLAARMEFEKKYSEDINYNMLMTIYEKSIDQFEKKNRAIKK